MKKFRLFLLFLTVVRFTLSGQTGREEVFDWTLSLSNRQAPITLSLESPVRLETGDRISFTLKSQADCFVYVIVQDSENAVTILHSNLVRKEETLNLGPIRITPPAGRETVFFVVSSRERSALSRTVTTARVGRDLLNAVYGLRRDISNLGENPERPLAMGGSVRGTEDLPTGLLFSGAATYVKVLTLEH